MPVKKLPNGKDIEISVLDTPTSLEKKIALAYGVDLRFLNKFTVNQHTDFANLNIVPLQELMDTYIEKHLDKEEAFSEFYKQTKTIYTKVDTRRVCQFVAIGYITLPYTAIVVTRRNIPSIGIGGLRQDDFSYTIPLKSITNTLKPRYTHDRGG